MRHLALVSTVLWIAGCAQDPAFATTSDEQTLVPAVDAVYIGRSLEGAGTVTNPVAVANAATAAVRAIATSDGSGSITWPSMATFNGLGGTPTGRVGIGIASAQAQTKLDVATENADASVQLRRYANGPSPATVTFLKALGTIAAPLAVSAGTNIFSLISYVYDGTGYPRAGVVTFQVDWGFAPGIAPGKFQIFNADPAGANRERFRVDSLGHWISPAQVAPTTAACGTAPVIAGTDVVGAVTEGVGATGCTITFATPYAQVHCTVTSEDGVAFSYKVSATGITVTNLGALAGTMLDYTCIGT